MLRRSKEATMRKAFLAAILAALAALATTGADTRSTGGAAPRVVAAAAAAELPVAPAPDRPANARADLAARWLDANGRYRFPPDDGFAAAPRAETLAPGTLIDRYGQPGGRFLAPAGTAYEARALPYDKAKMDYYRYEVLKPLPVKAGAAAPWFDQPGGGTQYMTEKPVLQLIADGSLRELPP
jgi:hypothetical protein